MYINERKKNVWQVYTRRQTGIRFTGQTDRFPPTTGIYSSRNTIMDFIEDLSYIFKIKMIGGTFVTSDILDEAFMETKATHFYDDGVNLSIIPAKFMYTVFEVKGDAKENTESKINTRLNILSDQFKNEKEILSIIKTSYNGYKKDVNDIKSDRSNPTYRNLQNNKDELYKIFFNLFLDIYSYYLLQKMSKEKEIDDKINRYIETFESEKNRKNIIKLPMVTEPYVQARKRIIDYIEKAKITNIINGGKSKQKSKRKTKSKKLRKRRKSSKLKRKSKK